MLKLKEHEARVRRRVQFATSGESLTLQSDMADANINNIIAKYRKGQLVDHVAKYQGEYGDFTEFPDNYHEAMIKVAEANSMFESVPADIRTRFNNDPGEFLSFVLDPANGAEMVKMGLKKPPLRAETPAERDNPVGLSTGNPPEGGTEGAVD